MNNDSRKKRTIIIIASSVLLVITGVIAWQVYQAFQAPKPNPNLTDDSTRHDTQQPLDTQPQDDTPQKLPERSNDDMTTVITKANPTLIDSSGQANFTILRVIRPQEGWYVATVQPNDKSAENAKVIFKDAGGENGLTIIAGPGTYFPPEYVKLPTAVRKALTQ